MKPKEPWGWKDFVKNRSKTGDNGSAIVNWFQAKSKPFIFIGNTK